MKPINRQDEAAKNAIFKILDLARFPHHCIVSERVKQDLIRLKLSKGDVLDEVIRHLKNVDLPLYSEIQTMDEPGEELVGYVFCPLRIAEKELYVKFVLPPAEKEIDEKLFLKACHEPLYPCPGAKK